MTQLIMFSSNHNIASEGSIGIVLNININDRHSDENATLLIMTVDTQRKCWLVNFETAVSGVRSSSRTILFEIEIF